MKGLKNERLMHFYRLFIGFLAIQTKTAKNGIRDACGITDIMIL